MNFHPPCAKSDSFFDFFGIFRLCRVPFRESTRNSGGSFSVRRGGMLPNFLHPGTTLASALGMPLLPPKVQPAGRFFSLRYGAWVS